MLGLAFLVACAGKPPRPQSEPASNLINALKVARSSYSEIVGNPQTEVEAEDAASSSENSAAAEELGDLAFNKLKPQVDNPFFPSLTPRMLLVVVEPKTTVGFRMNR